MSLKGSLPESMQIPLYAMPRPVSSFLSICTASDMPGVQESVMKQTLLAELREMYLPLWGLSIFLRALRELPMY